MIVLGVETGTRAWEVGGLINDDRLPRKNVNMRYARHGM